MTVITSSWELVMKLAHAIWVFDGKMITVVIFLCDVIIQYHEILYHKRVGRGGALNESMPFDRRVEDSNPVLAATY